MKHKYVTLMLLWQEYKYYPDDVIPLGEIEGAAVAFSSFAASLADDVVLVVAAGAPAATDIG